MMRNGILGVVASLLVLGPLSANVDLIQIVPEGVPSISGFIEFDDDDFDGTSFQFVSNSLITDLMITVSGYTFDLLDVVTTASTIINSSGAAPTIVNGAGGLAIDGAFRLVLFPGPGGMASISAQVPSGGGSFTP